MAARSPDPKGPVAIDTHAHVSMRDFNADRDAVIARSRAAGVNFVEIGFDPESSRKAVMLARAAGGICAVGVHPHNAAEHPGGPAGAWKEVESLLNPQNAEIAAIGEIGLDYCRNLSPKAQQIECFQMGLDTASRMRLPVVVHQRDAGDDAYDMVRRAHLSKPVVFHCFSGDAFDAKKCLDLGGFLGLGGVLTYPKNESIREAVRSVPLDRLLLETDCPYLTPQSHRGKRNEPSYVLEVGQMLADLFALPPEQVLEATTENARKAFLANPVWKSK